MDKVEDLGNRSRSSNLRFVRVPEAAEGRDLLGFMSHLIPQLLGPENFTAPPPIERAHRTPTELIFNGNRIFIYPDYSADLAKMRHSFDPVKRRLRELNLKFSLRYPCTLSVWVDGKEQQFTDHKAAEEAFISFRNSSMNSPP
ncbi:hypothetical protein SKAU_G00095820 [Synaphobranchus kaupii]|uniref:Uncharacterized protein n=1 Tax=Synaphobranchus kaupii TaxID=118154 RepID=A0A9Q1FY62_SYNKA|nr:hypothetical protein SKAU_G00095820 [Synaphobranchus kaupii]